MSLGSLSHVVLVCRTEEDFKACGYLFGNLLGWKRAYAEFDATEAYVSLSSTTPLTVALTLLDKSSHTETVSGSSIRYKPIHTNVVSFDQNKVHSNSMYYIRVSSVSKLAMGLHDTTTTTTGFTTCDIEEDGQTLRITNSSGHVFMFTEKNMDDVMSSGLLDHHVGVYGKRLKIGFLTSGGDSQGMNAVIRAIVRMSIYKGCEPIAIYEGFEGLVQGGTFLRPFSWNDVGQIISIGGTIIGSARCSEFRERSGRLCAVEHLVSAGIHSLVVIGGDGSLTGAEVLRQEWPSLLAELVQNGKICKEVAAEHPALNVAGIVGSIDNDLVGTDMTIGADSCLHRIMEAVDAISTTAQSHQRTFIIEVMGRHCGWLALMAAMACETDWFLIPEMPAVADTWKTDMCNRISQNRALGKRLSIVIVSEGAIDTENRSITSDLIKHTLMQVLGMEARITVLGHVQRGGSPSAYDRVLSSLQGVFAVESLLRAESSVVVGVQANQICWLSLNAAVEATLSVAAAYEKKQFDLAFRLRDHDFRVSYASVASLRLASLTETTSSNIRIGMICVGAPAGGMNMALHTLVHSALHRGYTPVALLGGWSGALESSDNVQPLSWQSVNGWASLGGTQIGIQRALPNDMARVAALFEQHSLSALVLIGGYEAFLSGRLLFSARDAWPSLAIPIVVLPATISNNVPGTEYSIGSDTALNMIVSSCDAIRLSASSTKRTFLIEVQGGNSGYLASFGGMAAGATISYVPEEGITLQHVLRDSLHLRHRFLDDKKQGRLILVNEFASKAYTCDVLGAIFQEEGAPFFDVRTVKLGHLQQGGQPSPHDRISACRYAMKAMDCIHSFLSNTMATTTTVPSPHEDPPAVMVGYLQGRIQLSPLTKLAHECDDVRRTTKRPWWMKYRPIMKILAKFHVPESDLEEALNISQVTLHDIL